MIDQTTRAKVLIVDDDDATLSGLAQLLTNAGYETQTASTFRDGLHLLRTAPPDLLLTDIRLGDYNGLQLVAINALPTPTIMVTGFYDPVLEADAHRLGADYIVKPVVPADLLGLIAQKLASRRMFKAVRQWERKSVNHDLGARIEDSPARIVDISYGGLRFEIERTSDDRTLPASFDVKLTEFEFSIPADLVWMTRSGERNFVCGATVLAAADQPSTRAWRELVDAVA
jgi:DNA-binding response OmpR family regulator